MDVVSAQYLQLADILRIDLAERRVTLRSECSVVARPVSGSGARRWRRGGRRGRNSPGAFVSRIRFRRCRAWRRRPGKKIVARQTRIGGHLDRESRVQRACCGRAYDNERASDDQEFVPHFIQTPLKATQIIRATTALSHAMACRVSRTAPSSMWGAKRSVSPVRDGGGHHQHEHRIEHRAIQHSAARPRCACRRRRSRRRALPPPAAGSAPISSILLPACSRRARAQPAAAIHFPARRATTIPKASGKWSTTSLGEHDRIDNQTGDDKEARDEQGFPKELQLDPCRIFLDRAVDRQSRQECADNPWQVYQVGDRAGHRHDREHQQEMGLLVTPHPAQCPGAGAAEPNQDQRDEDGDLDELDGKPSGEKPVV